MPAGRRGLRPNPTVTGSAQGLYWHVGKRLETVTWRLADNLEREGDAEMTR